MFCLQLYSCESCAVGRELGAGAGGDGRGETLVGVLAEWSVDVGGLTRLSLRNCREFDL